MRTMIRSLLAANLILMASIFTLGTPVSAVAAQEPEGCCRTNGAGDKVCCVSCGCVLEVKCSSNEACQGA